MVAVGGPRKPWQGEALFLDIFSTALGESLHLTRENAEWLRAQKGKMWKLAYLDTKKIASGKPIQIKDVVNRKSIVVGMFPAGSLPVESARDFVCNDDHETFAYTMFSEAEAAEHTYSTACHSDFNWSQKFLQVHVYYDTAGGNAIKHCDWQQVMRVVKKESANGKISAAMKGLLESSLQL